MGVAGMRAAHLCGPGPYIFEDPYALSLASEMYRELHAKGELADFFPKLGLLPILGQILGRARWNEEALAQARERGVGQYVILGAGLDSFALRHPEALDELRVFELDHPDSQRYKLARLRELELAVDPRLRYVEVDFEKESIAEALRRTDFDSEGPAFYSWLGVVTYLKHEDLLASLAAIQAVSAPGSEVAMDYPVHPEALDAESRALFESVRTGTAELGEPRRATHAPEELRAQIEALGYACIEDLSSVEHQERYFAGREDGLRPYTQVHLARFRVL